jgi:hypothetical protein
MMDQRLDLIKPFLSPSPFDLKDYIKFYGMDPATAEKLMTGWPNVSQMDRQNDSPNMRSLVDLAKKHDGLLGGYVISDPKREDRRITFDTVSLMISDEEAREMEKDLHADACRRLKDGRYNLWWD